MGSIPFARSIILNEIMKKDFSSIVENNIEFIQQYSFDEWVSKLKLIAVACISFPSSALVEKIMTTKCYTVEYNECGISHIIVTALSSEWDSVKIVLNSVSISVSMQQGHSKFEPICTIPLEVLRLFNK